MDNLNTQTALTHRDARPSLQHSALVIRAEDALMTVEDRFLRLEKFRTSTDIAKSPSSTPTLSAMLRCHNRKEVQAYIVLYLAHVSSMCNVHKPLTAEQSAFISDEVLNLYPHFTLADLHVIFRMALRQEFGAINFSLDVPKILEWFKAYDKQRTQSFIEYNDEVANRLKNSHIPARVNGKSNPLSISLKGLAAGLSANRKIS